MPPCCSESHLEGCLRRFRYDEIKKWEFLKKVLDNPRMV